MKEIIRENIHATDAMDYRQVQNIAKETMEYAKQHIVAGMKPQYLYQEQTI